MADRTAYTAKNPIPFGGMFGTARTIYVEQAIATGDLGLDKTVGLCRMPAGAVVIDAAVNVTDMDTGTPALVFSIGTAATAGLLFSGLTTAQAGGASKALAAAGTLYKFTADTEIIWTTTTAAATAAAGTVKLAITYVSDQVV